MHFSGSTWDTSGDIAIECLARTVAALLAAAIACAMLGYQVPDLAYLFAVPVVFASVLFGPLSTAVTAIVALFLIMYIGISRLGLVFLSAYVFLPFAITSLTTVASWLSQRSLYTALTWAWNGYERARQNEQAARERRAELRRALKALDEATHRLERANHMLALAREQAEEARRLKQQFAQTISHELRTPLNLIVGFTELMARSPEYYGEPLPIAYMRDLSIVHRNARHLQSLVNDVLDLARIEAAQMGLILENINPATLVKEAVNTARSLVESRGLALHTEIEPDLPNLRVDPTRIRQVLFNLLNNAARFTEKGSVTVSVRRRGQEVIFSVADTGVGIAPEDIPKIFQEFQQLDGSTRRRHGGAGLGLAISRNFVQLHGGRIWVESEVGKGSTFSFALPVQQPNMVITNISHSTQRSRTKPTRKDKESVLLAVTRSLSAAGLLTRYVQGVRVVTACDLEQAREAAREILPQAVVIDTASISLKTGEPGSLARQWNLSNVPFIACPLPGEEPLRQQLTVDGYLIKPVSSTALWDVLRRFGEGIDRVLVVDDDKDFVRLLSRIMDSPVRRYEVGSAYTGHEALEMLRRWKPDLVLLDLGLPDIDGLQIIERMQADTEWRNIPIIVVSGRDEISNLQALKGSMVVAKADRLIPGEVVRWIQGIVDTATKMSSPEKEKRRIRQRGFS